MGWAIGNAVGTLTGFVLGGFLGMLRQGGPGLGGILLVSLLATAGAIAGGLLGGLAGAGCQRRLVSWQQIILSALSTLLGVFVGFVLGGVIKSLLYDDGPDGFWLPGAGAMFGGVVGGILGGLFKESDATTRHSPGKVILRTIMACVLGYLVLAVLANLLFS